MMSLITMPTISLISTLTGLMPLPQAIETAITVRKDLLSAPAVDYLVARSRIVSAVTERAVDLALHRIL